MFFVLFIQLFMQLFIQRNHAVWIHRFHITFTTFTLVIRFDSYGMSHTIFLPMGKLQKCRYLVWSRYSQFIPVHPSENPWLLSDDSKLEFGSGINSTLKYRNKKSIESKVRVILVFSKKYFFVFFICSFFETEKMKNQKWETENKEGRPPVAKNTYTVILISTYS